MASPNLAIQAGLVSVIRNMNTSAGHRVFSEIPHDAQYPYVQVWSGFETPIDEEWWDRTESTMQIDVWADSLTYAASKAVAAAIRDNLHEKTLDVVGHTVDRIRVETIVYSDDPPHYRARMSIAIDTQPK
ncbi:tail completion protein gp17 [Ochrobactrum sp. MYb379]|uniref:tail completion protein gp17 n=1 Tax=Ochrobactrum sp. MYb379 TaxID=2745275 RepID=UPI00309966D3